MINKGRNIVYGLSQPKDLQRRVRVYHNSQIVAEDEDNFLDIFSWGEPLQKIHKMLLLVINMFYIADQIIFQLNIMGKEFFCI